MAKPKKDNRVKRKRGKKFVYVGDKQQAENQQKQVEESNPFEDHTKSKRARKDAEVREELLHEYKNRGRTSEFVDRRIGEKSVKMSEEDKMKMRFMAEQKSMLEKHTQNVSLTRKKNKFNLGDSDDDVNFNFLTHKGKKIEDFDDLDKVSNSSDEYEDRDMKKGIMTEEMVRELNFGGGSRENMTEEELQNSKKTREERHAEIMQKSKAYKLHAQEIKEATQVATKELDADLADITGLLNFEKNKRVDLPLGVTRQHEDKTYDSLLTQLKTEGATFAQPAKKELTEKEKAQARRQRLEKLARAQQEAEGEDNEEDKEFMKKREAKLQSKREQALQAAMAQQEKAQGKVDKANANLESIRKTLDSKKVKFEDEDNDSQLQSDPEDGSSSGEEYSDEEERSDDGGEGAEEGSFEGDYGSEN